MRSRLWALPLFVLGVLSLFGAAPTHAQFTPLCRSGTTGTKNCSGALNVSHVPSGIPAASIGSGAVSDADYATLAGAASLGGTLASEVADLNTAITSLSFSATTLFLHHVSSDVAGYETLRTQPASGTEVSEVVNVSSGTGPLVFDSYVSDVGYPGLARLPSGIWRFHHFAAVDSNTGVTQLRAQVYTRTTGGVETLRFTSDSPELVVGTTEYIWSYTQSSDITVDATDRLVVRYSALTTSAALRAVTQYYEGTTRASHLDTPIPSPAPISGSANLVQATPNGSAGLVGLRKVEFNDLAFSATGRMFPPTAGALANVTVCGDGTSWAIVGAALPGWLYASGPTGCQWVNALSGSSITFTNIPAATALTGQVPVANGGTNKASWTVGSIPVATAGTTIGEIAPGTANHVLTSNGTGAAPTMQALPTASSGTSTLGSAFALTSTDTYQDTGLSVSLPSSGTYLLTAQVKATLVSTTGAPYATCRLFNVTAGAVVANSELLVAFGTATSTYYINTATQSRTLTVGAASTIRLECARRQASAWSVSEISSDVDGRTAVTYVKLAS